MITKAIIEEVLTPYEVRIRIPLLDSIASATLATPTEELNVATICSLPNCYINVKQGDIVFVGFEDYTYRKAVILGHLSREACTSYADVSVNDLTAHGTVLLPETTDIGAVSSKEILMLSGVNDNIQRQIDSLEERLGNSTVDTSKFATIKEVVLRDIDVVSRIPTKTSQLINDSDFATEGHVKYAIAQAQLGGDDSDIDLSGFATKDEILVNLEQTQKSTESGGKNVWTATFGDGTTSTIEILNGKDGVNGKDGKDGINGTNGTNGTNGKDGTDGKDGVDGKTPYIRDGYWYIDGVNTGVKAEGKDGTNGINGVDGKDGLNGKDGTNGTNGKDGINGVDGKTPYIKDGYWWIGNTNTGVKAVGIDGSNGTDGVDGKDGTNGEDGLTPHIGENGNWCIGETDTGVRAEGKDGTNGKDADTSQFYTKVQVNDLVFALTDNLSAIRDNVKQTDEKLNELESSLKDNNVIIPTKLSEFENDVPFVTSEQVADQISDAVKDFVTESDVNNMISSNDFVNSSDLNNYVTNDDLNTLLNDYITEEGLDSKLENKADTKDLENYATKSQVTTIQNQISDIVDRNYVTAEQLAEIIKQFNESISILTNKMEKDIQDVRNDIPYNTSELNNDAGFTTTGQVNSMIQDALNTDGTGGGASGDSGNVDGNIDNIGEIISKGEGEQLEVTFVPNMSNLSLSTNVNVSTDGIDISITPAETSAKNNVEFPITLTCDENHYISEIVVGVSHAAPGLTCNNESMRKIDGTRNWKWENSNIGSPLHEVIIKTVVNNIRATYLSVTVKS